MVKRLLVLIFILQPLLIFSQNTWVFLGDKDTAMLKHPELFLSKEALAKRAEKGIKIDVLDLPVNPQYISRLNQNGFEVLGNSKWLNAVLVKGCGYSIESLREVIPNIRYTKQSRDVQSLHTGNIGATKSVSADGNTTDFQHKMIGVDYLHSLGYYGQGVTITLMDAGYYNVDSIEAFKSLWGNGQITHWWDFVDDDDSVFRENNHGMSVLSIIGGNIANQFLGAAPQANFMLLRTEDDASETHQEELNWVKAMEWADSVGTDIIHSSLGYSEFDSGQIDYDWVNDMDGNTTIITIAADIAASRGILVTNSAGNEGNTVWQFITAPCDGDSVLCVGAVDSNEVVAAFSSHGPAADWRIKPEVVALGQGTTLIQADGTIGIGNGTSFSGPLVAGLAACLMSARPDATNMDVFYAIEQSGDRYKSLESFYGQGVPHGRTALCILDGEEDSTATLSVYPNPTSGNIYINGYVKNRTDFTIVITDILGHVVWSQTFTDRGNVDIVIDTEYIKSGLYFVNFIDSKTRELARVSVVR